MDWLLIPPPFPMYLKQVSQGKDQRPLAGMSGSQSSVGASKSNSLETPQIRLDEEAPFPKIYNPLEPNTPLPFSQEPAVSYMSRMPCVPPNEVLATSSSSVHNAVTPMDVSSQSTQASIPVSSSQPKASPLASVIVPPLNQSGQSAPGLSPLMNISSWLAPTPPPSAPPTSLPHYPVVTQPQDSPKIYLDLVPFKNIPTTVAASVPSPLTTLPIPIEELLRPEEQKPKFNTTSPVSARGLKSPSKSSASSRFMPYPDSKSNNNSKGSKKKSMTKKQKQVALQNLEKELEKENQWLKKSIKNNEEAVERLQNWLVALVSKCRQIAPHEIPTLAFH